MHDAVLTLAARALEPKISFMLSTGEGSARDLAQTVLDVLKEWWTTKSEPGETPYELRSEADEIGNHFDATGHENAGDLDIVKVMYRAADEIDDLKSREMLMRRALGYARKIPRDLLRQLINPIDAEEVIRGAEEFGS